MKKILILNGTISEIPIIRKAQEMGFYVVTTGNMPDLPGHSVADAYIPEDYSDREAILNLVRTHGIEGIVSCANDFGVITSAYVAEKMGWPGHDTYEHAVMMHHKDGFRKYFIEKGFPSPETRVFGDLQAARHYCSAISYPVMIKANDLTGGKGIQKVSSFQEAERALKAAFAMSRDKRVLVEEYIDGVQQSIVVFLVDQKIAVTSCSNIYCMHNPYLVQAETYPATHFDRVEKQLSAIIHEMASDLNLADGIFSFQYIERNGVPYVIDMMRRCFGNETLLLADMRTGFPWEEAYIRASLGMDCTNLKWSGQTYRYCGHYGVMADRNGVLRGWTLPEDIENRLFKKTVNMKDGAVIHNYLTEKIAHIYFHYDDLETMNREIVEYNDRIIVSVLDDGKVS